MLKCLWSEGREPLPRHAHNTHEMVYVQEGAARFVIGGAVYEVGAHTLVFISSLEEHSMEILREPYRRWWVQLTAAQLAAAADDPRLRAAFDRRPAGFCHVLDAGAAANEIETLLRALEGEEAQPFAAQRRQALLSLLLIVCYRVGGEVFCLPERRVNGAVLEAQTYIDAHFAEPLTLAELAERVYLSPSYLSHAFREWTGVSPKQYLLLCRLSYARELLLTTDEKVEAVAVRCGFGDVNNFIRAFRRQTGVTPGVYRRAER